MGTRDKRIQEIPYLKALVLSVGICTFACPLPVTLAS